MKCPKCGAGMVDSLADSPDLVWQIDQQEEEINQLKAENNRLKDLLHEGRGATNATDSGE